MRKEQDEFKENVMVAMGGGQYPDKWDHRLSLQTKENNGEKMYKFVLISTCTKAHIKAWVYVGSSLNSRINIISVNFREVCGNFFLFRGIPLYYSYLANTAYRVNFASLAWFMRPATISPSHLYLILPNHLPIPSRTWWSFSNTHALYLLYCPPTPLGKLFNLHNFFILKDMV